MVMVDIDSNSALFDVNPNATDPTVRTANRATSTMMVSIATALDDDRWTLFNDDWRTTLNDHWWSFSLNDNGRTTMAFMAVLVFIVDNDWGWLTTNQTYCGQQQKCKLFHIHLR
jgi:hypothetical protein